MADTVIMPANIFERFLFTIIRRFSSLILYFTRVCKCPDVCIKQVRILFKEHTHCQGENGKACKGDDINDYPEFYDKPADVGGISQGRFPTQNLFNIETSGVDYDNILRLIPEISSPDNRNPAYLKLEFFLGGGIFVHNGYKKIR